MRNPTPIMYLAAISIPAMFCPSVGHGEDAKPSVPASEAQRDSAPEAPEVPAEGDKPAQGHKLVLERKHTASYPHQFRLPARPDTRPTTPYSPGAPEHANQGYRAPGLDARNLRPHDDFIEKALAEKRLELLNLVDDDDQQVFLGLTREGFLGVQVQMRDRKR